jgi:hypothetical protein
MLQNNGFAVVCSDDCCIGGGLQYLPLSAIVGNVGDTLGNTVNSSYLSCWNVGQKKLLKKRYQFSRSDVSN